MNSTHGNHPIHAIHAILIGGMEKLGSADALSAIAKQPVADEVIVDLSGLAGDE